MKYYICDNDETLVMLTLAGDQTAYEVLVERYRKSVIASALAVCKNYYMAEDAAQDAFVTAWIKLNTLHEPSRFCGWVCKIARYSAINAVTRYRAVLPLDGIDNTVYAADVSFDPQYILEESEDKKDLDDSVERLPERVKKIIRLHYFEGMSIVDISEMLRISEGAVKSQLHDGRKRIRRELCAMNEKWNDTLVQKVMKKVEELKNWQVYNNKDGFEKVYTSTLKEIEGLPESKDKNHALADVLMRGWWWLPGRKNEELFARIREAAETGKNEDVMAFIITREDERVTGEARIDFIKEKQIPRLEKAGFVRALGVEWFWLANSYYRCGRWEEGDNAAEQALRVLQKHDAYHGVARLLEGFKTKMQEYEDRNKKHYRHMISSEECRYIDGSLRFFGGPVIGNGYYHSLGEELNLLQVASRCDGRFFDDSLSVGQSVVGSDGAVLTYVSEKERVETPCGVFEDCQRWQTEYYDSYMGNTVCNVYYKNGVGIVRFEHEYYGVKYVNVLDSCNIVGGSGLLPIAEGNRWVYKNELNSECVKLMLDMEIGYSDSQRVIFLSRGNALREKYNENSWEDMMDQVKNEYCSDDNVCDVSKPLERAEALALTPMQKLHTGIASKTARRIMETAPELYPETKRTGHWNFFVKKHLNFEKDRIQIAHCGLWSFEWKVGPWNNASYPLLYNDILGILQDAANCIWSDEWQIGASPVVEYCLWGRRNIKTSITCTDGGTVETKGGRFENCMMLTMDIDGMEDGWLYRGGKKIYYFCPRVGIVKTVNYYCGGARKAVYELIEYKGEGEGYMPIADGLYRKYCAIGLTDGYVGEAEYTFAADEKGEIFIFADRTGVRNIPDPVSSYAFISAEIEENNLWEEKKRAESRLRHDVNNFNIVLHYLGRPTRIYAAPPKKALEWGKHCISFLENLGEGKGVPLAWVGRYGEMLFRTACYCFGNGDEYKEEGYSLLDRAFEVYMKWVEYPVGAELDVGNEYIYGGIKYIKDTSQIKLPDGTVEAIEYGGILEFNARFMYRSMTVKHGWEWFNPVRDEERFKEYVEKIKTYADKEK